MVLNSEMIKGQGNTCITLNDLFSLFWDHENDRKSKFTNFVSSGTYHRHISQIILKLVILEYESVRKWQLDSIVHIVLGGIHAVQLYFINKLQY